MAVVETKYYKAHHNIYTFLEGEERYNRSIRVDIGTPSAGINEETGIMVLIPGYGAGMDNNIYRKMKQTFPEEYNVITLQVDYFGNKFMHSYLPKELEYIDKIPGILKADIKYIEISGGTIEEFDDMGFQQAMDIVGACLQYIQELQQNGKKINYNKVILFGVSHGSYLSYLCNLLCPFLFTYLLDISSYLNPYYLKEDRILKFDFDEKKINVISRAFLKVNLQCRYDERLYDLRYLYFNAQNRCKIISLHGVNDWMTDVETKAAFIQGIDNAELIVIREEDVDGQCFKNAGHGFDLDFILFIRMIMNMIRPGIKNEFEMPKESITLGNGDAVVKVDYQKGLPILREITGNPCLRGE